jgi:Zn finger protein HypA/HybF involved in hydrogenase expression
MKYNWECPFCDTEFEVEEGVSGECPNCHKKYEWDFDGDYGEDSVYTVGWYN